MTGLPGMCLLARLSGRTEAGQVVYTEYSSHVPVPAIRSVPAEPPVIPRTVFYLRLRVNMEERALLVVTGIEPGVEIAFRHLGHIVLVKELALVTLLTQASQPMFTNNSFVPPYMSEGTGRCFSTVRSHVKVTDGGPRLIHPWEGKRLCAELITERELDIKHYVLDGRH